MIIGLTGGIACGKSTVSALIKEYGIPILDADKMVHEMQKKGTNVHREIVTEFGEDILLEDGELDRKRLGQIVFNDKEKLKALNGITRKHVVARFIVETEQLKREHDIIVWDVPLLIESGMHRMVDKIIVVDVNMETQIQRLMARNALSEEDALARVGAAMSTTEKKGFADIVIDNNGTLEETKKQIHEIIQNFMIKN